MLARSVLVPFRFYVLMYPEAGDRQRKNLCFWVSEANLKAVIAVGDLIGR